MRGRRIRGWEVGKVTDRFEYTKIVSKANYVKNVFLYEWDLTIAVLTARTDTPEYMIEETQRQTQMLGGGEGRRTPACDNICPVPWTRSRVRKPAGTPSAVLLHPRTIISACRIRFAPGRALPWSGQSLRLLDSIPGSRVHTCARALALPRSASPSWARTGDGNIGHSLKSHDLRWW